MGFFNRFRYSLARFMEGRYGIDALNKTLFLAYFVLFILGNVFLRLNLRLAYVSVYLLELFALLFLVFRTLSKNYYKRRAENDRFLGFFGAIKAFFKLEKSKWRDRKTHVYKKCPHCHATLRLPKKRGKHTCCCPKCRCDFSVKVR